MRRRRNWRAEHARIERILNTPERRGRIAGRERLAELEQQLLDSCHPKQRDFVADPAKEIAALVGRGGGKTTGGRARFLIKMARIPRARCLYIATTRPQAEEFMWGPLKELNERLGLGATFSESKLRMTMPNGSTLRLVGADDRREIEKLRGQPFHEVQVDEAATHSVQILNWLIERIIGPRLGDFDGVIVMYGTPGHILAGDFYEATRAQSEIGRPFAERVANENDEEFEWSTHAWTLLDAVAAGIPAAIKLWDRALRTKRKKKWSDDHPVWRREYLGFWSADNTENVFRYRPHLEDGTTWNQWDPELDVHGFAKLPEGEWLYTYGADMGHSDPFALEIFAHQSTTRELRHVYEFSKEGMTTRAIAELLVGKLWVSRVLNGLDPGAAGGLIGVTGWPYGLVADIAGLGGAILQELAEVYGIPIEAAEKKHKHDSIELTNGDLLDGRIKVLKGSVLETQLLQLQWAIDPYGKLIEDKGARNDCTDALIYLRRKAMHLIGEQAITPAPEAGTVEARETWAADSAEEAAARSRGDEGAWTDMLADTEYNDDAYEWG